MNKKNRRIFIIKTNGMELELLSVWVWTYFEWSPQTSVTKYAIKTIVTARHERIYEHIDCINILLNKCLQKMKKKKHFGINSFLKSMNAEKIFALRVKFFYWISQTIHRNCILLLNNVKSNHYGLWTIVKSLYQIHKSLLFIKVHKKWLIFDIIMHLHICC